MVIIREADLQKTILDYLTAKRIFHWRNNSGATKVGNRFVRYGLPGSPDVICVVKGQFIGIEVKGQDKRGVWGKQNENQVKFQQDLEKAGGKYILAKSLNDVIEKI